MSKSKSRVPSAIVKPPDISEHLKIPPEIAASKLEALHRGLGGDRLQPELAREPKSDSSSMLIEYFLIDGKAKSYIRFEPIPEGGSLLTLWINDSERWAWLIGIPGRSEVGITTYLGHETSPACDKFCNEFLDHLEQNKLVGKPSFFYRNKDRILLALISIVTSVSLSALIAYLLDALR